MSQETKFGTTGSKRLFELLSEAAGGFDNTEVLEAGAVLVAQAISSGCYDLAGMRRIVNEMAAAMIVDIERNWVAVIAQRNAKRQ